MFSCTLGEGEEIPEHLISLVELVLDQDDQLVEEKRLPGENNVSLVTCAHFCCTVDLQILAQYGDSC